MRRPLTALLTLAAVLLLAGCAVESSSGTDSARGTGETTRSPTPSPPPTPDTATADAAPFPGSTEQQLSEGSGGSDLVLVDVRVREAAGFDRVVLEFSGRGTPGWAVSYVDVAMLERSGEHVALGGDAVLDIYASGTTWPAPDYYTGPRRVTAPSGGAVDEVYVAGTSEGTTQVLAGIKDGAAPFRVFALAAPARLVVDVVDVADAADAADQGGD